jgi:hypothetical protein
MDDDNHGRHGRRMGDSAKDLIAHVSAEQHSSHGVLRLRNEAAAGARLDGRSLVSFDPRQDGSDG